MYRCILHIYCKSRLCDDYNDLENTLRECTQSSNNNRLYMPKATVAIITEL